MKHKQTAMTVEELIKKLRKYPLNTPVAVAHHDNAEQEIHGFVRSVIELDEGDMTKPYDYVIVIRC